MLPIEIEENLPPTVDYRLYEGCEKLSPPSQVTFFSWLTTSCKGVSWFVGASLLVLGLTQPPPYHDTHGGVQIPTLLNVHDGFDYVHALWNPLYEELRRGAIAFVNPSGVLNLNTGCLLGVSADAVSPQDALSVSWDNASSRSVGSCNYFETDVLIFVCGSNQNVSTAVYQGLQHYTDVLDAMTLQQARTTSQFHNQVTGIDFDETALLSLPRLPILRYDVCRFFLYRPTRNREVWFNVAASNLITVKQALTAPTGIHLAFTSDSTSMNVNFVTGMVSNYVVPVVRYAAYDGTEGGDDDNGNNAYTYTSIDSGTTTSYTNTDMCQAPANEVAPGRFSSPGLLHSVTMTDLTQGATYSYQVGIRVGSSSDDDGQEDDIVWSDEYEFTAALDAGDETSFTYLVYADQGCPAEYCWEQGREWMQGILYRSQLSEQPLAALHHFGDLSYAWGAAHHWDSWLDMVEDAAARIPLMIGVGNHEYDYSSIENRDIDSTFDDPSGVNADHSYAPKWGNFGDDSFGECGIPTARRFTMPDNGNGAFWYSHEYGMVHTIVLSSEHNLTIGCEQYEWLAYDLASIDRSMTPWVVVELHRPLYEPENYYGDYIVTLHLRYQIETLLFAYEVDLVLAGHYHAYLRTCDGLYQSKCGVTGAPTHITVGTAGAGLDNDDLYDNGYTEKFFLAFGHGRITVQDATTMLFEFVQAGAIGVEGAGDVLDSVYLYREREAEGRRRDLGS